MKKEKKNKNKIGTYISGFFLILGLVCLLTLKETTLLKKVICCNKANTCQKNQNDKFEITNNLDDIIEKQVSISSEEAGEIQEQKVINSVEESIVSNVNETQKTIENTKEVK